MVASLAGTPTGPTSTASPLTIVVPTGVRAGDHLLVGTAQRSGSSAGVTEASVTGLVNAVNNILRTNATTSVGVETFWALLDGTEGGASTSWPLTGSGLVAASAVIVRGGLQGSLVNASAGGTGSGTSVVAPTLTTTKDNCLLLRFHGGRLTTGTGVTYTADGATTEYTDSNAGTTPNISLMAAWEQAGAAGSVGTRTGTASASLVDAIGQTVAIAPAVSLVKPTIVARSVLIRR